MAPNLLLAGWEGEFMDLDATARDESGTQTMRLFLAFVIISLLATATARQAEAGVGAKSVQGLFSTDECERSPNFWDSGQPQE